MANLDYELRVTELLAKYKSLLDSGAITQEEYEEKKKAILSGNVEAESNDLNLPISENIIHAEPKESPLVSKSSSVLCSISSAINAIGVVLNLILLILVGGTHTLIFVLFFLPLLFHLIFVVTGIVSYKLGKPSNGLLITFIVLGGIGLTYTTLIFFFG